MSWRRNVLTAAATMVAVLGALGTTLLVRAWTSAPGQISVLAVVLALTMSRSVMRGIRVGMETLLELVVLSFGAAGVAWLLVHEQNLGQALLVVGLGIGIAARRYRGFVRRAGQLVALPFLAILVTPVGAIGHTSTTSLILWSPVGGAIGALWASAVLRLVAPPAPAPAGPSRPSRKRIDAPTRMAAQMLVGLAAAMVVGRLLFDERWAWCVLSAFVVASGNRGRGDVVVKAANRIIGALVGTIGATALVAQVPPHHRWTLVALFAVMAVALVLRPWSYAYWAAGMTAMLSLLHGYYGQYGQSSASQLRERLIGVVIGSALGLAAAWFVLPVRTRDVFRGRLADALRALSSRLAGEDDDWTSAVARLQEIRPTLRSVAGHHARARTQLAALDALSSLEVPTDPRAAGVLRRDVGRVRKAFTGDVPDEVCPSLEPVLAAVISA